jgi:hypothetical protein
MVISTTMHRWFLAKPIFWTDYPSIRRWISNSARMLSVVPFCSLATACPGKIRPQEPSAAPFVFMPEYNPVQEALENHAVTPENGSRRGEALTAFLADILATIRRELD